MASPLKAIRLRNFKSIGPVEQTLNIRPLTVLAGANSSGKSTLMQPLLLHKQTMESPFNPGYLMLQGPNVNVTEVAQLISRIDGADKTGFQVGYQLAKSGSLNLDYRYSEDRSRPLTVKGLPKVEHFRGDQLGGGAELSLLIYEVLHVGGDRSGPYREYPATAVGRGYRGRFEAYTASAIFEWQTFSRLITPRDPRPAKLAEWLSLLDLTNRVEAKKRNDVSLELRVAWQPVASGKHEDEDLVSIADVGLGIPLVLPCLVALLAAGRNGLVYIEQPELHLHPNSQVKLAHVLAEAATMGPSIVIETHSDLLLRELQTLIAEGKLDRNLVGLNWCSRDPETGATIVTEAQIDEDGSYGDWPADFDAITFASDNRYLDAVAHKRHP